MGPLDGCGLETPRVQDTLLPNPSEGSAPSLRAAASESASCRRLGVTQAVASVPRATRPWPSATPYLTLTWECTLMRHPGPHFTLTLTLIPTLDTGSCTN